MQKLKLKDSSKTPPVIRILLKILRWFFGIIFIFIAMGSIRNSVILASLYFITGLLLLPPIDNVLRELLRIDITVGKRTIIIVVLIFLEMIVLINFTQPNQQSLPVTQTQISENQQACTAQWNCTQWSNCSISETHSRTCKNTNNCSIGQMPSQIESCTPSLTEIRAGALKASYYNVFRYNENYVGKYVYFRGEVVQIVGSGENFVLRVATKQTTYDPNSYYDEVIYVDVAHYTGDRILENDVIDIWGKVKGLQTYETVLHSEITIPELEAAHIAFAHKVT